MNRGNICRRSVLLILAALLLLGGSAGAMYHQPNATSVEITENCKLSTSEGAASKLNNGLSSTWQYKNQGAQVIAELPEGVEPGAIVINWEFEPSGFEIVEYDALKNALRTRTLADTFPNIVTYFDLVPETKYVVLTMTAMDQAIADLNLYSAGIHDEYVQMWNPPVEKADLMVISTHQDDELIFFGGTIPYYDVAQKRPTVVVYMADCARFRRQEALAGLWAMGVKTYPEFINLKDARTSYEESLALWGGEENVVRELVQRIRRYKPEVIVTHDFNGEYGHNQHRVTARNMQAAIDAAADSARFPESASQYGAWQVKKLYIHLYDENQVYMDWITPLEELGGISPLLAAKIGYAEHVSQHRYYQVEEGGKYDNALYGLYFSTVGEDVAKNDFFENLTPATTATPAPTEIPVMVSDAETTPVPQETAGPVPESESVSGFGVKLAWVFGGIAAMLGGVAVAVYAMYRRELNRRRRRRRRAAAARGGSRTPNRRVR